MGNTAVDPDLQIRRGGGEKREDPVSKKTFSALWASVWSKNKGGEGQAPWAPPLDPPLEYAIIDIKRDSRLAT